MKRRLKNRCLVLGAWCFGICQMLRLAAKIALKEAARQARTTAKEQASAERIAFKEAIARLEKELAELRGSYYLSGARKKIDVREIDTFSDTARLVMSEGRLGMDYDRLYTLWQAALGAPPSLPFVEVGTYKGGSAKFIAETLRRAGRAPTFYVCDTFTGHARVDQERDSVHRTATKFLDTSAEDVAAYLAGCNNVQIIAGDIIETSARLAHEHAYGFVHVDVDVYPATDFCLRFFAPRLATGALLIVDDYGFLTCPGAKKAVDDFVAENHAYRLLHLLTGQALVYRAV